MLTNLTKVALQAWLVPHQPEAGAKADAEVGAKAGFGLGPTAAVHSGFSLSWGTALKGAVCKALQGAVMQNGGDATRLRIYVTGLCFS